MASSIASLAKAGFIGELALDLDTVLGLTSDKTGGGGGSAIMGGGGGDGGDAGEVHVKEGEKGDEEGPVLFSTTEAILNFCSSTAASDLVWRTQRSEKGGVTMHSHAQTHKLIKHQSVKQTEKYFYP